MSTLLKPRCELPVKWDSGALGEHMRMIADEFRFNPSAGGAFVCNCQPGNSRCLLCHSGNPIAVFWYVCGPALINRIRQVRDGQQRDAGSATATDTQRLLRSVQTALAFA
eukprot:COSAG02_NODE_22591_length_747_cov_0.961420_2_plen_109_part_01